MVALRLICTIASIVPGTYSSQGLCFTGGGSQIRSYPF